jgi:hypothetical protein
MQPELSATHECRSKMPKPIQEYYRFVHVVEKRPHVVDGDIDEVYGEHRR